MRYLLLYLHLLSSRRSVGELKIVHFKENQTLDFNKTYPCPSCRQGSLIPITLTEAWGCDHCRQIFEQREEPNTVGKLATPYHRQRTWRWNGQQWVMGSKLVRPKATNAVLVVLLGGLLWFSVTQLTLPGFLTIGIIVLILLILVVMFWVVFRR